MTRTILFNHSSPHPNAVTGITVYSWNLLEALARRKKYNYILVTNWDEQALPPIFSELGVRVIHRPNPRNEAMAWLNENLSLWTSRRRIGADLMFSPHPFSVAIGPLPRVLVVHDLRRVEHPELHSWQSRLQWKLLFGLSLRRAAAIIAVSRATRDAIAKHYPHALSKTDVVQEASPLKISSASASKSRPDKPYGLMVANITPIKRLAVLTGAMRILRSRGREQTIVLVGRNDSKDTEIEAAVRDGLDLRVVQNATDGDLEDLYRNASFYVNTSIVEGFCLPILEAQTLGCPILCSDLPVLREVAGEGALFLPPGDSVALADAIERLMDRPDEAERLRAAGLENAKLFSWDRAARETEAVFEAVLGG
jgi:glycosyltransferase involved in cell wall biosynthesis